MSNSSTLDELPPLSDEDVNILYSIVSLASQSSDPPFRALFAAYDNVLADNGIPTEHDQLYFRYLLRLGEGPFAVSAGVKRTNGGLVPRLRALLARLDIHIVIGGDEDVEGEEEARIVRSVEEEAEERVIDERYAIGKRREDDNARGGRRRSSFNDTNLEETWVSEGRLEVEDAVTPKAGRRRRASGANGANGANGAALKPLPRPAPAAAAGRGLSSEVIAQRLSRGNHAGGGINGQRARSLSTQGSLRISRQGSKERHLHLTYDQTSGSESFVSSSELDSIASSPPVQHRPAHAQSQPSSRPPPPVYAPAAPAQVLLGPLLASADAFQATTVVRIARQLLHRWHDQAIRLNQSRHDMNQIALNYDHQTLLSQAIITWRRSLADKRQAEDIERQAAEEAAEAQRQAAETVRFYEHLERRATRARDLYLLNKAFTHWAQCASDEVARTNVAKRHILRVRYFNAWKDITAVNELKSRRLGLRKWLSVWRANTARKAVENERALAIHEEKLVERMYWKWFWSFCDHKAPVWRNTRQKRSILQKLTGEVGKHRQMNQTAQDLRNFHLTRRALAGVAAQSRLIATLDAQAIRHNHIALLSRTFNTLRKHSQLAPRWREHEQVASSRLALKTIHVWSLNTTLAQRASSLDRQRLIRNALTDWNDSLRSKVITNMIDDRIKAEAWYKWILHERLNLFRRMADYRLVERTLQTMSVRLAENRFRLGEAEAMFQQDQRRRVLMSVMLKLNRQSRNEEYMERQALEFRNTRLMRDILPTWQDKHQHVQQLQRWSNDARFYCLTHSAIRRWNDAATNAKRVRRRDAYAIVRRRIKVNLVQNYFAHWREQSAIITQSKAQAESHYQTRLFAIGTTAFDQWTQVTHNLAELNAQSEDLYTHRLISRSLSQLAAKAQLVMQDNQEAEAYATQTVHAATKSEMMRRMKWELFCLKRNNDSSEALKRRNEEQHRRNMVRYWAEGAMQRRASRAAAAALVDPESPSRQPEVSLFSSLRLPSARKIPGSYTPATVRRSSPLKRAATTGHSLPEGAFDTTVMQEATTDEEEEMDFGASTTARAEEWTGYDFLRGIPVPNNANQGLPTLNEETEPASNGKISSQQQQQQQSTFATPLPGYLRTPSKRTARQRTRIKALNSVQRPTSLPNGVRHHGNEDGRDDNITEDELPKNAPAAVLVSTTPAPYRSGALRDMETLTPQVTPFDRKMRAGGFGGGGRSGAVTMTPGFGKSRFGRGGSSLGPTLTTGRSVRFFDVDGDERPGDGNGHDAVEE